jgi:hypothetical protein
VGPAHFSIFKEFQTNSNARIQNLKQCSWLPPKFTKLCEAIDVIKGNDFPFGSNFTIKIDFELEIWK